MTYSDNSTSNKASLTIEGSGHASGTKISGTTLTIGAAEPVGTLTVKVTSTEDNSKSNTVNITVTAKTWKVGEEATIDGDVYIVAAIDGNNALMLRKYVLNTSKQMVSTTWATSSNFVYDYLNENWLNSHSSIKNNAVSKSHPTFNGTKNVNSDEKVFLLSAADVGFSGSDYTYGSAALRIFTDDDSRSCSVSGVGALPWWLRSSNTNASEYAGVDENGQVSYYDEYLRQYMRPAFWYPINSL